MKNNTITLETKFWAAFETNDPFTAIDAFIDYGHIDYYKQTLSEVVIHSNNAKIHNKHYPGETFILYTALRSFVRACWCIQRKRKKWVVNEPVVGCDSILHQASLTKDEYNDPLSVFKMVFKQRSLAELEFFLCESVHLSLSPHIQDYESDLIAPYIYTIKLLDAAQLIKERGIEKVKKQAGNKEDSGST